MSDDDVVNLAEHRAQVTQDCCNWSVRDMLAALLREIDAGRISPDRAFCYWTDPNPGGGFDLRHYCAGMNRESMIALLATAQSDVIEAWRN